MRNIVVQGVGGQVSRFIASRRMRPMDSIVWNKVPTSYVYANASARLAFASGRQAWQTWSVFENGNGGFTGTGFDADLNVMRLAVRDKVRGGAATLEGEKTLKYLVVSASVKIMLTNQDIGNCEVTLFDVVTKRDTPLFPQNAFQTGLQDQNAGAVDYSTVVGVLPTSSQLFNTNFKIVRRSRIVLGGGQSHCHYVNLRPNKILKSEMLSSSLNFYRGFSYATLIVAHGCPYNNNEATVVSTGSGAIDVVTTKQLGYKFIASDLQTFNNVTNNITTLATEKVMAVGGTTAAADAQA